ncbi:MAG TPA: citramalate synthase, partial [bacterium]|nr:citramalate synthase [bacterium]
MTRPRNVRLYDTTLRDGCQAEGVSFSVREKVMIAHKLDEFGIHYIEGGWPGSNPKDIEFFQEIYKDPPKNAIITAFGSTRRAKVTADKDPNLCAIVESKVRAAAIFGKCWVRHV